MRMEIVVLPVAIFCLVFGGIPGKTEMHTLYAGSFDDPSRFKPRIAIFMSERAPWAAVPEGLTQFERMPG